MVRARGLSLVEVIVAASLVALVMMMLFNLLPGTLVGLRQTEHRLKATMFAQALLETEHAKGFTTLLQEAISGPGAGGAIIPSATNPNGPQFRLGDDSVQYYSDEQIRLESTYGWVPCPGLKTPCCCTTCCNHHPTMVIVDVYEYWNEREDHAPLLPPASPATYHTWHTLYLEQWISDIQP